MKGLKLSILILFLGFVGSVTDSLAQIDYTPRKLEFQQPTPVFIPSFSSPSYVFVLGTHPAPTSPTCVIKSPVHYTAFFCKMEVKTQQTLGIMIKVHAGDYDRYTTGTDQPQP